MFEKKEIKAILSFPRQTELGSDEAKQLLAVESLLKIAMKKNILHIKLMNVPLPNVAMLSTTRTIVGTKSPIIVDFMLLRESSNN